MSLTDAEYTLITSQMMTIANIVRDMPLDACLERIERTKAIAPLTHPSLYQAGIGKLLVIERLAVALRDFQRAIPTSAEAARLDDEAMRWLARARTGG